MYIDIYYVTDKRGKYILTELFALKGYPVILKTGNAQVKPKSMKSKMWNSQWNLVTHTEEKPYVI